MVVSSFGEGVVLCSGGGGLATPLRRGGGGGGLFTLPSLPSADTASNHNTPVNADDDIIVLEGMPFPAALLVVVVVVGKMMRLLRLLMGRKTRGGTIGRSLLITQCGH